MIMKFSAALHGREDFLLRRAVIRGTITYRELADGKAEAGSPAFRTTAEAQMLLPLPPPVPVRAKRPGKPQQRKRRVRGPTKKERRLPRRYD